MEGSTYDGFAAAMSPAWRVLALDQRGHGQSDHASSYTRDDYLGDMRAWLQHLDLRVPVVLLGNSLGGVNAYQFAARHPGLVRALVVEDIGPEVHDDLSFSLNWAGLYPSREDLAEKIGPRMRPYLEPSFRQTAAGWTLAFDPAEVAESQRNLCGDHWHDWLATTCPALLVRGAESRVTSAAVAEQMAARRPNTEVATLSAGHVVHLDDPAGFARVVKTFLDGA
jgi:pimeloyl-ACP methyl ester carboxylesterase